MTDWDNLLHVASNSYETYKRCCCFFAVYPLWSILRQFIAGFVCCACHCVCCLFLCFLYRTSVLSRFLGTPAASGKLTQSPWELKIIPRDLVSRARSAVWICSSPWRSWMCRAPVMQSPSLRSQLLPVESAPPSCLDRSITRKSKWSTRTHLRREFIPGTAQGKGLGSL